MSVCSLCCIRFLLCVTIVSYYNLLRYLATTRSDTCLQHAVHSIMSSLQRGFIHLGHQLSRIIPKQERSRPR